MDQEQIGEPIEPGMKTVKRDTELEKRPENFALVTVEKALAVEPLLSRPEWFDEQNPVEITEDLLLSVPGVTIDTINRFKEALEVYKKYPDVKERVNERMNPFRGNVLTSLITPAISVLEGGDFVDEFNLHAHDLIGDELRDLQLSLENLKKIIAYRKNIGHQADLVDLSKIEEQSGQGNQEILDRLDELKRDILAESKVSQDEIKLAYAFGELTSFVIRDTEAMPIKYRNINELLEVIRSINPVLDEKDFHKSLEDIKKAPLIGGAGE